MDISRERRGEIIAALRKGTVPQRGLDFLAVGLGRFESAIAQEMGNVAQGGAVFKAVRGDYGFRRTVRYTDIEKVEVGRTLILEGWGIHYSIRGGWVWNLWGRDCVVVCFKKGGPLRIGTDDAEKLAGFLEGKVCE